MELGGMTVTEMLARMSLEEMIHWVAYSRIRDSEMKTKQLDQRAQANLPNARKMR